MITEDCFLPVLIEYVRFASRRSWIPFQWDSERNSFHLFPSTSWKYYSHKLSYYFLIMFNLLLFSQFLTFFLYITNGSERSSGLVVILNSFIYVGHHYALCMVTIYSKFSALEVHYLNQLIRISSRFRGTVESYRKCTK